MTTQLEQFRQQLYESLPARAGASMDLLDALSSNTTASSVVELSLNPTFRYGYSSVYAAIGNIFQVERPETAGEKRRAFEQEVLRGIVPHLPVPRQRNFW